MGIPPAEVFVRLPQDEGDLASCNCLCVDAAFGDLYIGTGSGKIVVFDQEGLLRHVYGGHSGYVAQLLFYQDSLWSASFDATVIRWSRARETTKKALTTFSDHQGPIHGLACNEWNIFSASSDCTVRSVGGKIIATLPNAVFSLMAPSKDLLVCGLQNGDVHVVGTNGARIYDWMGRHSKVVTSISLEGTTGADGLFLPWEGTGIGLKGAIYAQTRGAVATKQGEVRCGNVVLARTGSPLLCLLWDHDMLFSGAANGTVLQIPFPLSEDQKTEKEGVLAPSWNQVVRKLPITGESKSRGLLSRSPRRTKQHPGAENTNPIYCGKPSSDPTPVALKPRPRSKSGLTRLWTDQSPERRPLRSSPLSPLNRTVDSKDTGDGLRWQNEEENEENLEQRYPDPASSPLYSSLQRDPLRKAKSSPLEAPAIHLSNSREGIEAVHLANRDAAGKSPRKLERLGSLPALGSRPDVWSRLAGKAPVKEGRDHVQPSTRLHKKRSLRVGGGWIRIK